MPISITLVLSTFFEKIASRKLSLFFLEGNSLLPPSQFSHRRGVETSDALVTVFHHLQVALKGGRAWRECLFSWTSQLHLFG